MTDMKKTLFLWLALGATTTAFAQSPDGITGASAVRKTKENLSSIRGTPYIRLERW